MSSLRRTEVLVWNRWPKVKPEPHARCLLEMKEGYFLSAGYDDSNDDFVVSAMHSVDREVRAWCDEPQGINKPPTTERAKNE